MRVFFHKLGTDWRHDEKIFGDGLPEAASPGVSEISDDGKHAMINISYGCGEEELYYLNRTISGIQKISGEKRATFRPQIENNVLYIMTDLDAPKFKLCSASLDAVPSLDRWKTLLSEQENVLEGIYVVDDKLFVNYSVNVTSKLQEFTTDGVLKHDIALPCLGSASTPCGEKDFIFFSFQSFAQPHTVYQYNALTGTSTEFSKQVIPFTPELFTSEQVWYKSKDGTPIPMFIVHAKSTIANGKNPTILTGYGGFNISESPYFSAARVSWLEQGGVIAIANLRGGGEFGEEWHRQGMLKNKQNCFDDFIAAGEALTGKNQVLVDGAWTTRAYTNAKQLGISGGSNGGLLVGAVLVQRPDLWAAVDCSVPLLDMLRFHLTDGGKWWVSEYGSVADVTAFKNLLSYSPYHNVKNAAYPAVIFETSLGDDRGVDPMHAMKMAALVQTRNTSENPILLNVKKDTGHGHGKPLKMIIHETTDFYSFMKKILVR